MKKEFQCEVLYQECLRENCYRMVLKTDDDVIKSARPGQFVHLKINKVGGPLLRRPFSIHQVDRKNNTISLLYAVVGQGTQIMAADLPGKTVDVLGPLGTGFPVLKSHQHHVILIGGGMGVAPLLFAATKLVDEGKQVTVIMGFPSKDETVLKCDFQQLGIDVLLATDDGSVGFFGFPTDLLEKRLLENGADAVFACGPHAMLKSVADVCSKTGVDAWVSMEERMACGIGACLGCVVQLTEQAGGSYQKACVDGPVFKASEVLFE